MNEMVMRQHTLFRAKVKSEKSLKAVKRKRKSSEEDDGAGGVDREFEFSLEQIREEADEIH
jgi:hypothetical protein